MADENAKLEILRFPDPRLRKKSVAVDAVSDEFRQLATDMLQTMYASKGIGLAAPQVNHQIRLLVVDTRARETDGRYDLSQLTDLEKQVEQPVVIFNPNVIEKDGKTSYEEGCLSVPGYFESVERADHIVVEGLNLDGEKFKFETDGLLAICIQHEIDHLDGKLFIDRLSPIKSNRIKAKIKKLGYTSSDEEEENSKEEVQL